MHRSWTERFTLNEVRIRSPVGSPVACHPYRVHLRSPQLTRFALHLQQKRKAQLASRISNGVPLKCSVKQMAIAQLFQSDMTEEHKLFQGLFGRAGDQPNIGTTSRVTSSNAPGTRSRPNSRGRMLASSGSAATLGSQPSQYWVENRGGGNMTLFHQAEGRVALDPKLRSVDTPGPKKLPDAYDPSTQMRASSPLHPPMNTMQFSSQTAERFPVKIDRDFEMPRPDRSREGFDAGSSRKSRNSRSASSIPAGDSTIVSETWTLDDNPSSKDGSNPAGRPSTAQTGKSMWSISDGWDKRPLPQDESLLFKFRSNRAQSATPRPRKVVVRKADAPLGRHTMGVGERVHPLLWDGNPSTTFSVGSPGKQDKAVFPGAIYTPQSTLQEPHLPDCNFSSQERFVGFGAVMPPAVTSQCKARSPNYELTQPTHPCSANLITGRNQPKMSLGAFSPGPKYNTREIPEHLLSTKPSTFSFVIGTRHDTALR